MVDRNCIIRLSPSKLAVAKEQQTDDVHYYANKFKIQSECALFTYLAMIPRRYGDVRQAVDGRRGPDEVLALAREHGRMVELIGELVQN